MLSDISWSAQRFAIDRRSLPGNYTLWAVQYGRFLLRDAVLSMMYAVVVCLPVTLWYCIKTAKRRIMQLMPHDRSVTLVYTDKRVARSLCHSRAICYCM